MSANRSSQSNTNYLNSFTIKDGIIKGQDCPFLERGQVSFGQYLLDRMRKNRKLTGQIDTTTGNKDSFESMIDRSIRCALWLQSEGIKSGDTIAICTHNHKDQIIPALASLYIGAVFNPWWDHGLTKDIAKHFANLVEPKVLFVNEMWSKLSAEVTKEVKPDLKIVVFGHAPGLESFEKIISKPGTVEVANFKCATLPSVEHPALILYTSGTTGLPKGALHSQKSLFGNIKLAEEVNSRCHSALCYSTLCWVTGIFCSFLAITKGMTRNIPGPFEEEDACRIIQNYKIDWILSGTSMANRLLKSGFISKYDVSSVTDIHVGGAPLKDETQVELRKAFKNASVVQLYGATELGGIATMQDEHYKKNSVGNVVKNCQLKVIDPETNKILGPNQQGELCAKTPHMMTGYWRNPEKTKEAIDPEGWYHTGDLAYYDEDGAIFIIERLKELIKWRGHHVPPAVIEKLIQTLPGVSEVAVVGVPDLEDDERPLAIVTLAPNSKVTEQEIHQLVDKNLPDQMRLRAGIKFVDQIPHTASGKISRTELKAIAKTFSRD
ncbi:luciferin 4-monooxygenase-like [Chelonus insularis]|uniref:luciferin 4-monooxygenase-like n=1 Tax=Chelonus insularis TaxID=460826 RepID=UPI00158A8A25|nr:luciferin 4-monooxygenase-like [Chelonus insularis]